MEMSYRELLISEAPKPIKDEEYYEITNKRMWKLLDKENPTQAEKDMIDMYAALIYFWESKVEQDKEAEEDKAAPPRRPQEILNTPCPTGEYEEEIDNLTLLEAKEKISKLLEIIGKIILTTLGEGLYKEIYKEVMGEAAPPKS